MDKSEIIRRIQAFAPVETSEKWDCSGWCVETAKNEIKRIMLALTVTEDVIAQAKNKKCDMIISHHPLFCVPLDWKNIDIYCAHTNLDKADGGTTDTLIKAIYPRPMQEREEFLNEQCEFSNSGEGFLRYIDTNISLKDFILNLKTISPNLRYVNNNKTQILKRIAFCAGSGSEFIHEAYENGADALVTGDLKFHTALESPIAIFDIGHFESEILVLTVFEKLINGDAEVVYANEKSPFCYE